MTTFHGGPADNVTLLLRRSPALLRVVSKPGRKGLEYDALDAPGDQPSMAETISVYRLRQERGSVHLCIRGGKGGTFRLADYEYVAEQPPEGALRSARLWNAWVAAQMATEPKEPTQ